MSPHITTNSSWIWGINITWIQIQSNTLKRQEIIGEMKQALFILLAFNVVSTFGKENNAVPYKEFHLEEGYQKTKRCQCISSVVSFDIFQFRPPQLSFRFNIKDVLEVDTEKHRISFTLLMYMTWEEPQVKCRKAVKFWHCLFLKDQCAGIIQRGQQKRKKSYSCGLFL